jgi:acyl carrier protein
MNTEPTDTIERVKNVVARTFNASPDVVTAEASLGQLPGWDSLGHLNLMMEIEKEFSVRFPTDKINQPATVAEICELLHLTQTGQPALSS